ncbi:MAG TPA: FtsX-like permease family protein [Candidatus Kapabacteria bacterium]|nr:FtsX-like permease family protein [Candidatus Kapabacteria bacterium]
MLKTATLLSKLLKSNKYSFNRFTEIVAVASIILGTLALVLALSILDGFDSKLREFSMKFSSHITIATIDNSFFAFNEDKVTRLKSVLPDSSIIVQGLSIEGIVKSKSNISSISLRAINKKSYQFIKGFILDKEFDINNLNDNEIIIGKPLADKLNLKVGDNFIVFLPRANEASFNDFKVKKFNIKAIYHSGMTQYDEAIVYSNFYDVANLIGKDTNQANFIQIYLKNPYQATYLTSKIDKVLEYPFFSYTIFEMNQQIFSWIELQKEPIPIILASITIVAVLNIITTLLVLILEKVKSIGILRAIGISRSQILKLVVKKGFKITLIGSLIGNLISFLLLFLQFKYEFIKLNGSIYYIDALPVSIKFSYFLWVNIFTIFLGTVVAFLPAYIASKSEILKAIKFN